METVAHPQDCDNSTLVWLAVAGGVLGVVSEVMGCTSDHLPSGLADGIMKVLKSECVRGWFRRKFGVAVEDDAPNVEDLD